ncbi:MAG: hypothetical protein MUC36_14085 [Planctomycetes bacterium]|jgi:hypothetical protein|nr:hypothetical protein [Planctomycetota bacterium]
MSTPRPRVIRFPRADLAEQLEAFACRWPQARADRRGLVFQGEPGARLRVPLTAPRVQPGESVAAYAARLPGPSERQLLLLLQAGAMAIGWWDGDELVQHKAVRRYVVRGSGRAQPLHSKTRGKSRYGSRLRLQNWKRLLVETNQRLRTWYEQFGAPERLFVSVPVRAFADLLAAEPPPPFGRDDACLQRVPMHVHRPDFAELQRVHRWLASGRLELPG